MSAAAPVSTQLKLATQAAVLKLQEVDVPNLQVVAPLKAGVEVVEKVLTPALGKVMGVSGGEGERV